VLHDISVVQDTLVLYDLGHVGASCLCKDPPQKYRVFIKSSEPLDFARICCCSPRTFLASRTPRKCCFILMRCSPRRVTLEIRSTSTSSLHSSAGQMQLKLFIFLSPPKMIRDDECTLHPPIVKIAQPNIPYLWSHRNAPLYIHSRAF
jgi:hypothetical protein